jgi:hypothetical protein
MIGGTKEGELKLKAQPMYADLTLTGWVGRQRGISFNAFLGWTF